MSFKDFTFQFGDTLTASAMSAIASNFVALSAFQSDSPVSPGRGNVMALFDGDRNILWSRNVSSVVLGGLFDGEIIINYSTTFSQSIVNSLQYQHYGILCNAQAGTSDAQSVFSTVITEQSSNRAKMYHHRFNEGADAHFKPDKVVFVAFE
tara:strand:- start:2093 stop:2545 length:453 start_codon:yes stop_codon:yes gene_type:complete